LIKLKEIGEWVISEERLSQLSDDTNLEHRFQLNQDGLERMDEEDPLDKETDSNDNTMGMRLKTLC